MDRQSRHFVRGIDNGGPERHYLAEQSQAVFVCFCAVLQQSMALLELVLASLTLF